MSSTFVDDQRIGQLLYRSASIYLRHFLLFYSVFLFLVLPIWVTWDLSGTFIGPFGLLNGVATVFATGVITVAIHDICVGNRPTLSHSFAFASRRFGKLFRTSWLEGVLTILGFLCFIIPGLYITIRYLFSASVVIVEDTNATEALKRSASLIRGRFWKAAIVYFTCQIVAIIAFYAGSVIELLNNDTIVSVIFGNMMMLIFIPLPQIAAVLLYYDSRVIKEDYDIAPILLDVTA